MSQRLPRSRCRAVVVAPPPGPGSCPGGSQATEKQTRTVAPTRFSAPSPTCREVPSTHLTDTHVGKTGAVVHEVRAGRPLPPSPGALILRPSPDCERHQSAGPGGRGARPASPPWRLEHRPTTLLPPTRKCPVPAPVKDWVPPDARWYPEARCQYPGTRAVSTPSSQCRAIRVCWPVLVAPVAEARA